MKDMGKSSSRKLRHVIYYTLYRMDPQKITLDKYVLRTNVNKKQTNGGNNNKLSKVLFSNIYVYIYVYVNVCVFDISILQHSRQYTILNFTSFSLRRPFWSTTKRKVATNIISDKYIGKSFSRKLRRVI